MSTTSSQTPQVETIFERLRGHAFHPLDADRFTVDRHLGRHGIADLNDPDWRLRLLAVRDLVRCGWAAAPGIAAGLGDADLQVRYAAATALGILRADAAVDDLERVAGEDGDALARSPAVVALGEMESRASLDLTRECRARDSSRDVLHQAELAIYQIEHRLGATRALEEAWRMLDDSVFGRVEPGETAPDFTLADADGEPWCLREVSERGWVVLIWIFAHWFPVCHREFRELIELREEFERHHVQVATLECHDRYRCRVMTGRDTFADSLACLRPMGVCASYGHASGPPPTVDVIEDLGAKGSLFVTRPAIMHYVAKRADLEASAADLFDAVISGKIKIAVNHVLPLREVAEAHRAIEAGRTTGSTVLLPFE